MRVRLFALVALTGTIAFAGWERNVFGPVDFSPDTPPPHPLAYFLVDPCLRPIGDRVLVALQCSSATPTELDRRHQTQTDLVEVGKIGEFIIYDLWYSRNGPFPDPDVWSVHPDVRSILVKTARDQYREINVQVRHGYMFPPSEIVELDGEPILIAKSHDGGNHNRIDMAFYMFRPSGPAPPDFTAIGQAVAKLTPPNMSIRTVEDNFGAMTRIVETYRHDLNLPPVSVTERGRITVTYRFVNGRAVVTGAKYEPHLLE